MEPKEKPKRRRIKRIPSKLVDWKSVETLYTSFGGQGDAVALALLPDATDDERARLASTIRCRASRGKWTANKHNQVPKLKIVANEKHPDAIKPVSGSELAHRMHQNHKETFLHKSGFATAKAAELLADKALKSKNFADIAQDIATFEPTARVAKIVYGLGQDAQTNINVQVNALSGGFKPLEEKHIDIDVQPV